MKTSELLRQMREDRAARVADTPRCPACGSVHVEACRLIGHIYPLTPDATPVTKPPKRKAGKRS